MQRRTFAQLPLAFVAACSRKKAFDGYAYVANREGNAVAVVDLAIFAVIRHVRLNASPTAVLLHPRLSLLYVLTPSTGGIHEVDTAKLRVVRSSEMGSPIEAIRAAADGSDTIYAISGSARKLLRIPLETLRPDQSIDLPAAPRDFDLSEHTGLAGFSYGDTGETGIADLKSGKVLAPTRIGESVGIVRFRSGGRALLAAKPAEKTLTVIDAPGGGIVTHLPLSIRPERFCFNSDGGQLFITGDGMDAVVVVYPHDIPQIAETALAGRAPGAMAASSKFLIVANPLTNDVSIFNADTRRLIANAQVGASPGFIAITPGEQYALVLNESSGDMAVINLEKVAPSRRRTVGLLTMIPVGSKPVAAVVQEA